MTNTTRISFVIGTFIATGLAATVATASPTHWQVRDYSAYGSAFQYDVCESTGVDFGGSETTTSGGGAPVKSNTAWASYWSYNYCTGAQTSGWAWLDGSFDGDMNGASIDISFEAESYEWAEVDGEWVYNYLGTSTVEINAELTGAGQIMHGMSNSMSRWGSSFSHYRSNGQYREASIDLSVTVDGNPIELSNAMGSIAKTNSGSIYVYE
jgi:hypothetical protein